MWDEVAAIYTVVLGVVMSFIFGDAIFREWDKKNYLGVLVTVFGTIVGILIMLGALYYLVFMGFERFPHPPYNWHMWRMRP